MSDRQPPLPPAPRAHQLPPRWYDGDIGEVIIYARALTPNGVPITLCDTCHREHPQGRRHCDICGRPSAFIQDNGRCLALACREAKK